MAELMKPKNNKAAGLDECYGTQGNGMAKRDDEQYPCVKEVSKAVVQVQSDCYSETGQRHIPT